jgi:hypothetical protein
MARVRNEGGFESLPVSPARNSMPVLEDQHGFPSCDVILDVALTGVAIS